MKAVLYAVTGTSGWRAHLSVDWQTDRRFWTDPSYRSGALEGWGDRPGDAEMSAFAVGAALQWSEPIPLGIAEAARDRLFSLHDRVKEEDAAMQLKDAIRWAAERTGENPGGDGGPAVHSISLERSAETADGYAKGVVLGRLARRMTERMRGLALLHAEMTAKFSGLGDVLADDFRPALQLAALLGGIRLEAAVAPDRAGMRGRAAARMRCRRCGSGEAGLRRSACASCGRMCFCCEVCLTMGRCRECGLLAVGCPSESDRPRVRTETVGSSDLAQRWKLNSVQSDASAAALAYVRRNRQEKGKHGAVRRWLNRIRSVLPARSTVYPDTFLLWAVTGAGKTEMMFPLLEAVLAGGGRAAVAAPRRDVVLELAPRLAAAFPEAQLRVLYGGSADRFEAGELTLATTHQLIRFREAFDLVVVDEADAFPFHNDPMLHYAAAQARAAGGTTVLLSATPSPAMQRAAKRGGLAHARVSARHHGRPLPVPRRLAVPSPSRWTEGRRLPPAKLFRAFQASVRRGAQLFLFVPYIGQVDPLVRFLRDHAAKLGLPPDAIDGTSSRDPDRGGKVDAFRRRTIRMLVTTTILERGVTIPGSDVFVLDADKPVFDASSLVQMAGRAGRSADDPDGFVHFAGLAWTETQRDARKQIRDMNACARRKGYLRP